ncbi:COG4315 family predicted lipoprotein [Actinokineospora sp. HUAS TT18]|uniref:COG4315 family predicted lipoprotein n=1 Tax=Actinokineospora sp. HUAS TT18 TaxID=3447451 RepID=UPI003F51D814
MALVCAFAVGCASEQPPPAPEEVLVPPGTYSELPSRPIPAVGVSKVAGRDIVVSAEGFPLYTYDKDTANPAGSACEGECVTRWPPAVADDGMPIAMSGIDPSSLGVLVRADGKKQITLAGRPLYRFVGDSNPSEINGDGVDGQWHVATAK